jgi:hypothetical protein
MYLGGIIVPILIGCFLIVLTFVIERVLTVSKASGKGSIPDFIRKVQYHLANKDVDKAMAECDRQKGSVGNVMKAGLRKYKEMIGNTELATEQKVLNIQKEVEEATALELPMLEKKPCVSFYTCFCINIDGFVRYGGRYDQIISLHLAKVAVAKLQRNYQKVFRKLCTILL